MCVCLTAYAIRVWRIFFIFFFYHFFCALEDSIMVALMYTYWLTLRSKVNDPFLCVQPSSAHSPAFSMSRFRYCLCSPYSTLNFQQYINDMLASSPASGSTQVNIYIYDRIQKICRKLCAGRRKIIISHSSWPEKTTAPHRAMVFFSSIFLFYFYSFILFFFYFPNFMRFYFSLYFMVAYFRNTIAKTVVRHNTHTHNC